MDFHSLSRKELQTLCKQNKIPANITNLAMADALSSLPSVEGIEEFINGVESDNHKSPEKLMSECPENPKTAGRTVTRGKKIDAEKSVSVVSTRRATRKFVAVDAETENKNVTQLVTPAVPVTRTRRMPTTAVSARQTSVAKSMQRGGGTRQSVRLLEKSLRGMSLNEEDKVEQVNFDMSESNKVSEEIVDTISGLENFSSQNQSLNNGNDDENKTPEDEMENCGVKLDFDGDDNLDNTSGFDTNDEVDDGNFNELESDSSTGGIKETLSDAMISEMANHLSTNDVELEDDIAASLMEAKNAETEAEEEFCSPNEIKESLNLQGLVEDESEINSIQDDHEHEESHQVSKPSEIVLSENLAMETEPEDHKLDHELEETHQVSNYVIMEKVENNESLSESESISDESLSECESITDESLSECESITDECPSNLNNFMSKATVEMVSSPFASATLQGQFPRPTVSTPVKSVNHVSDIDNEENIHTRDEKLETEKDEMSIMGVESVEEMQYKKLSMRKLTKMVKELEISKNKKAKNGNKDGKARTPLQRIAENCMATTESGNEF